MATTKQADAVSKIVENRGIAVSRAMIDVGYAENTAKNPKNLTESKGYQELLEQSGLTQGLIATSLVEDILAKPGKRVTELNLGAEITGMKKRNDDKTPSVVIINISKEAAQKYDIQE